MKTKICPLCFFNPNPDMPYQKCENEECSWWCEEAQKCAILVIAETQRKEARKK